MARQATTSASVLLLLAAGAGAASCPAPGGSPKLPVSYDEHPTANVTRTFPPPDPHPSWSSLRLTLEPYTDEWEANVTQHHVGATIAAAVEAWVVAAVGDPDAAAAGEAASTVEGEDAAGATGASSGGVCWCGEAFPCSGACAGLGYAYDALSAASSDAAGLVSFTLRVPAAGGYSESAWAAAVEHNSSVVEQGGGGGGGGPEPVAHLVTTAGNTRWTAAGTFPEDGVGARIGVVSGSAAAAYAVDVFGAATVIPVLDERSLWECLDPMICEAVLVDTAAAAARVDGGGYRRVTTPSEARNAAYNASLCKDSPLPGGGGAAWHAGGQPTHTCEWMLDDPARLCAEAAPNVYTAAEACCACGGGRTGILAGFLVGRVAAVAQRPLDFAAAAAHAWEVRVGVDNVTAPHAGAAGLVFAAAELVVDAPGCLAAGGACDYVVLRTAAEAAARVAGDAPRGLAVLGAVEHGGAFVPAPRWGAGVRAAPLVSAALHTFYGRFAALDEPALVVVEGGAAYRAVRAVAGAFHEGGERVAAASTSAYDADTQPEHHEAGMKGALPIAYVRLAVELAEGETAAPLAHALRAALLASSGACWCVADETTANATAEACGALCPALLDERTLVCEEVLQGPPAGAAAAATAAAELRFEYRVGSEYFPRTAELLAHRALWHIFLSLNGTGADQVVEEVLAQRTTQRAVELRYNDSDDTPQPVVLDTPAPPPDTPAPPVDTPAPPPPRTLVYALLFVVHPSSPINNTLWNDPAAVAGLLVADGVRQRCADVATAGRSAPATGSWACPPAEGALEAAGVVVSSRSAGHVRVAFDVDGGPSAFWADVYLRALHAVAAAGVAVGGGGGGFFAGVTRVDSCWRATGTGGGAQRCGFFALEMVAGGAATAVAETPAPMPDTPSPPDGNTPAPPTPAPPQVAHLGVFLGYSADEFDGETQLGFREAVASRVSDRANQTVAVDSVGIQPAAGQSWVALLRAAQTLQQAALQPIEVLVSLRAPYGGLMETVLPAALGDMVWLSYGVACVV